MSQILPPQSGVQRTDTVEVGDGMSIDVTRVGDIVRVRILDPKNNAMLAVNLVPSAARVLGESMSK